MLSSNFKQMLFRWSGYALQKPLHLYKRILRRYKTAATDGPLYDVVVVGGGHAGAEAASAAARMGCKTLLLTEKIETIGKLFGSPYLGGAGSGHLIKEIDALDGVCGRICDLSGIHYMVVNKHRTPGLWGPKAYVDTRRYQQSIQGELSQCKNLETRAATVENLVIKENEIRKGGGANYQCSGVILADGNCISSKMVILAIGTSLRKETQSSLNASLQVLGFKQDSLKIGVAPRLDTKSIDLSQLTAVNGDKIPAPFSFLNDSVWIQPEKQMPTYIARTNPLVEETIQHCIQQRICIPKDSERSDVLDTNEKAAKRGRRQQVWLEPEGLDHQTVYLGGFCCPLPEDEQAAMIRQLEGLEKATIINHAYDLLYQYIDPRQVNATLETQQVSNLFLAGHLLGTGGYEEAAAQGVIAGINAGCKVLQRDAFVLTPKDSYIGSLIHYITTQGICDQPFVVPLCSQELSAVLRSDNADLRLSEVAITMGCISQKRQQRVTNMRQRLKAAQSLLLSDVRPMSEWLLLLEHSASKDEAPKSALEIFSRPTTDLDSFVRASPDKFQFILEDVNFTSRLRIEAALQVSELEYQRAVEELKNSQSLPIPEDVNFKSTELKLSPALQQKFTELKPHTIQEASCIEGVSQDHLLRLVKFVKKHKVKKKVLKKQRQKV